MDYISKIIRHPNRCSFQNEKTSLQQVNRVNRHLLAQQFLADAGRWTQQIASTRVPISPYVCMVNLGAPNTSGHETHQGRVPLKKQKSHSSAHIQTKKPILATAHFEQLRPPSQAAAAPLPASSSSTRLARAANDLATTSTLKKKEKRRKSRMLVNTKFSFPFACASGKTGKTLLSPVLEYFAVTGTL